MQMNIKITNITQTVSYRVKRLLPKRKKWINIIFRYDDFSALSRVDLELSILDVCRKNHVKFTFAVVPSIVEGNVHEPGVQKNVSLSNEKVEILRSAVNQGLIDIALHGFSHQSTNSTDFSELVGLDYDRQFNRISRGKNLLEDLLGSRIDIFAPPWNSYDEDTIKVLEKLNFNVLSAGRDGVMSRSTKLKILPSTCSLKRLRSAIQQARACTSIRRPIIVVLFHEFEFLDIDQERGLITLEEFSNLISWLSSQKDIRVLSIGQAVKIIKGFGAKRFLSTKKQTSAFYQ